MKNYISFSKLPLSNTFSLLLTVNEVWNVSNKHWLPSNPAKKYFDTRDLSDFLHFKRKQNALHIAEGFKNILFLPFLLVFTVDVVRKISNK